MKKMKRLAALFLAVVMIMAMGMTAMAEETAAAPAGTSKITIKAAVPTATYTAYKIFKVTTDETSGGTAYTRPASATKLPSTDLFKVIDNGGDVYYIPKDKLSGSELASYLQGIKNIEDYALDTATGTPATGSTTVELTGLEEGYYYVKSTAGTVAMLRAIAGQNSDITEKNTDSNWGDGGKKSYREVWNDANENDVKDDGEVTYVEDAFYAIGETVHYEVTYKSAYNYEVATTGTTTTATKVYQYTVKDMMPAGVEIIPSTFKVKVGDTPVTAKSGDEDKKGYTGSVETGKVDIQIPWAKTTEVNAADPTTYEDFYYAAPAVITVSYDAKVTAAVNAGVKLTNRVEIAPNTDKDTEDKHDDIYTGSVQVRKYDNTQAGAEFSDTTKLAGAEFVIIDTATVGNGTRYLTKANDGAIDWTVDASKAFKLVVKDDGTSEVLKGLDQDTYYLLETKAPAGYNMMDGTTEFKVAVDKTGENVTQADLVFIKDIGNKKGAVLPSTGGIGTTIFYVVGGIMVLGAGVLLITKKRMSAK